jgi:SAP domain
MSPKKRPLSEIDINSGAAVPQNKKTKGAEESSANPPPPRPPPDYDALSLPELKDELRKRELHISGSRPTLVQRLKQSDHDRSLPVKQAIEAAARRRREELSAGADHPSTSERGLKTRWDREQIVLRGGPNGPPVYDDFGYKLDYEKIAKSMGGSARYRPNFKKMEKWVEKKRQEQRIKARIMGVDENTGRVCMWDDRVAQDLEIPYHKVEICDYEEWQRRGFTFDPETDTKEEMDRVIEMSTGSAFRA